MQSKFALGLLMIILYIIQTNCQDGCSCNDLHIGNHCDCKGNVQILPENMVNGSVHILSISYGSMTNISKTSLLNYKSSLRELTIVRMRNFTHIDDGALDNMQHLNLLRIVHTFLRRLPKIKNLGRHKPLHSVDFESNMIETLESDTLEISAEQLILDYNRITSIHCWAFRGSEIGKLSLRGNKYLTDLSAEAFSGLKSLRDLDLSETSINFLPTSGLEELEILRLTNTPTLTTIPSIYDLTKLERAYLTYFFHCCAFHYPARHDPIRHQKYLEAVEKFCKNIDETSKRIPRNAEDGFGDFYENIDYIDAYNYNFNDTNQNYTDVDDPWHIHEEESKSKDETFHDQSADLPTAKMQITCGNLTKRYRAVYLNI